MCLTSTSFSPCFSRTLLHTKNLRVLVVMFLKEFLKVDVFAYVVIYMPIMSNVMIAFNVFVNHITNCLSLVDGCGYRTWERSFDTPYALLDHRWDSRETWDRCSLPFPERWKILRYRIWCDRLLISESLWSASWW